MKANVKRSTVVAAFIVAVCADLIEMAFGMIFAEGFASPLNDVMDVVVCIILTALLGWHIAFIPSFLVKLIPVGDLAPTWTIAVLIATRAGSIAEKEPPIIGARKPGVVDVEATVERSVPPEK
jgi:CDP-diglyceride synthetase